MTGFKEGYHEFSFLFFLFVVIFFTSSTAIEYGQENYGTEWVFFLDMDGNKRYVDLTESLDKYQPMADNLGKTRKSDGDNNINYWLYTRENVNDYQVLIPSEMMSSDTKFMPGKPLVLITHGWVVNGMGNATQLIKNAYLEQNDINVIVVDWGQEASVEYPLAALRIITLAQKVSQMVMALSERYSFDGSAVHLIGHSLGAHLMSNVGDDLKKSGFLVGRITGLDPAKPFFELPPLLGGISSNDAAFVDVIHTNIDILGITNAKGHADFYPNGGFAQKACCGPEETKDHMSNNCDHSCSYIYYKESIKYDTFKAKKCDGYYKYVWGSCDSNEESYMGEPCDPSSQGTFYLVIEKLPSAM